MRLSPDIRAIEPVVWLVVGPAFAGFAFDLSNSFLAPSLVSAAALVVAVSLVMNVQSWFGPSA